MHMTFVDGTGAIRRGKVSTEMFLVPHVTSLRSLLVEAFPS